MSGIPYRIRFSYWQKIMSTVLQKNNAEVLHLTEGKIGREFGVSVGIIGGEVG